MPQRLVVGIPTETSIAAIQNDTKQIAQRFMPRRYEVKSRMGSHVFSIQNYGSDFDPTNPGSTFEKWVGVEVTEAQETPDGMDLFVIPSGTYAVFEFRGSITEFPGFKRAIFQQWMPASGYRLDLRPHFEIMGEDYSKDLNNTEESVYIPVIRI